MPGRCSSCWTIYQINPCSFPCFDILVVCVGSALVFAFSSYSRHVGPARSERRSAARQYRVLTASDSRRARLRVLRVRRERVCFRNRRVTSRSSQLSLAFVQAVAHYFFADHGPKLETVVDTFLQNSGAYYLLRGGTAARRVCFHCPRLTCRLRSNGPCRAAARATRRGCRPRRRSSLSSGGVPC